MSVVLHIRVNGAKRSYQDQPQFDAKRQSRIMLYGQRYFGMPKAAIQISFSKLAVLVPLTGPQRYVRMFSSTIPHRRRSQSLSLPYACLARRASSISRRLNTSPCPPPTEPPCTVVGVSLAASRFLRRMSSNARCRSEDSRLSRSSFAFGSFAGGGGPYAVLLSVSEYLPRE